MHWFGDIFIAALAVNGVILLTAIAGQRESLRQWRMPIFMIGLAWIAWTFAREFVTVQLLGVSLGDVGYHEARGRRVAEAIWAGESISEFFRLGNPAYHVWVGLIVAVTDCSRLGVALLNALFGFWGSLLLLTTFAHRVPEARVPGWLVVLVLLLPTALMWTPVNLKEGVMYWGIAQLIAMPLLYRRITILGATGLISLVFFRPHIALAWVLALAGALLVMPRYRLLGGVLLICSFFVLTATGDFLGREIRSMEDVQAELDHQYQTLARQSGSAVVYDEGGPIPVISGALMLFARPFPWEIYNMPMLLTTVEIYALTLLMVVLWLRRGRILYHIRHRPELLIAVAACLLFFIMFSYWGNLGLMARQRLQAMPAILTLIAIPALLGNRQPSPPPPTGPQAPWPPAQPPPTAAPPPWR